MSRIAYVNGRYLPHARASVHVEDRGYQFADGVYEVIWVSGRRLVDGALHFRRLARSLAELEIRMPMAERALEAVLAETVRRNRVSDGIVYLQVTRGEARRDHPFPAESRPSLVVTAKSAQPPASALLERGVKVITLPDIRWTRCDIKSVSLLPNVLAKQRAREAGAFEAWQVDGAGFVTEGGSTNAWIIDAEGTLITRPAENAILNGITRLRLIRLAEEHGIRVEERAFTVEEAKRAREAFATSTTAFVMPVVEIDETPIGNGRPGSLSLDLRRLYERFARGTITEDATAA